MIIKRDDLEQMADEALQDAEDLINEIQAERRAASPDPIDAEREATVKAVGGFFKRLKGCKNLDEMWN